MSEQSSFTPPVTKRKLPSKRRRKTDNETVTKFAVENGPVVKFQSQISSSIPPPPQKKKSDVNSNEANSYCEGY
jgi:hypothetical protein